MKKKVPPTRYCLVSILLLTLLSKPLLNRNTGSEAAGSEFLRIEKKLFQFINRERGKKGLETLSYFEPLNQIASDQSRRMALHGQLTHFLSGSGSLGERLREARLFFSSCGENIVLSDFPVASVIHNELMNSGSHRLNILNSAFSHCGIGISSRGNEYYITQVFARLFDPSTDREAEFRLLEDLELWFVEAFNSRFVFHPESRDWIRELSGRYLRGKPSPGPAVKWGNLSTFRMVYPDLAVIRGKLQEEISGIELEAVSIGITSGRTREYPSGAYSVVALLFGNYCHRLSKTEIKRILLNRLNQLRVKNNLPVLKINPELATLASRLIAKSPRPPAPVRTRGNQTVFFMSMKNPRLVPREILNQLISGDHFNEQIGLAVQLPKQTKFPRAKILVCLIAGK